jgi:DNA-binding transcriptional ArsR family regulator
LEKIPTMEEPQVIDDPAVAKALFDPLRYRLFRLLESPATAAELARAVDLPADRLYYHLHRLVDRGLVRVVEVRRNGRHDERMYGRAARQIRFSGDLALDGGGLLRGITDELAPGLADASSTAARLSYHVTHLTAERASELEERLHALLAEYADDAAGEATTRYGALGVLAPLPEPAR